MVLQQKNNMGNLNIKSISKNNLIKLCFIDTETTGTNPEIHGIHQLSMIMVLYDLKSGEHREIEKVNLRMRPFDGCEYDEEALKVSEISKETIESYQSEKDAFLQFRNILDKHCLKYDKKDKYYFVGYNAQFDKDMCYSWFVRNGEKYFFSYFFSNHIDVMTLITPMMFASRPEMINFRLGTVAKFLDITTNDDSLHDAMYDIEITQIIFWKCYEKMIRFFLTQENESKNNQTEASEKLLGSNLPEYNFPLGNIVEKQKILNYDSVLSFGKYRGKNVKEISEENASYLLWIDEQKIKDYRLADEIKEELKALAETQSQNFRKKIRDNTYKSYL